MQRDVIAQLQTSTKAVATALATNNDRRPNQGGTRLDGGKSWNLANVGGMQNPLSEVHHGTGGTAGTSTATTSTNSNQTPAAVVLQINTNNNNNTGCTIPVSGNCAAVITQPHLEGLLKVCHDQLFSSPLTQTKQLAEQL